MGVTAQYVLHGINTASGFLSQISSASCDTEMEVANGIPAGLPGARFIYNLQQNPKIRFDCEQLKSLLDITGVGLADLTSGNTDLYFKAVPHKGSRTADASTAHIRMRAAKAVLLPVSLRARLGSPATLTCLIICTYDGTNEPLVPAGSVALAGTPTSAEHFVVGPASLNGSAINGVQEISIDFNTALYEMSADGELYVSLVAEKERLPVATIRTLSSAMPTFGLNGTALSSMSLWLRKCAQTARVANGTAEHILFSATSGLITVPSKRGGGNEPAMTEIRCALSMADATTAPLTLDTTAAIS